MNLDWELVKAAKMAAIGRDATARGFGRVIEDALREKLARDELEALLRHAAG